MTDAILIAEWAKNRRESVRVSIGEYLGQPVVDVRIWYRDGDGISKPGRHGMTLSTRHLPKLAAALTDARREAQALGIVGPEPVAGMQTASTAAARAVKRRGMTGGGEP